MLRSQHLASSLGSLSFSMSCFSVCNSDKLGGGEFGVMWTILNLLPCIAVPEFVASWIITGISVSPVSEAHTVTVPFSSGTS